MFIHQGKRRTQRHNLQIASVLSFVAGIVNVAGILAVAELTTNVTGHFAFFVDEVYKLNFWTGLIYFLYTICFLLGSFFSSLIVEFFSRTNTKYVYLVPTAIESLILLLIGIFGNNMIPEYSKVIACSLLFTMGLQNSLVTQISKAIVRTTHLTGLFTDLGIELSQLFFYKLPEHRKSLFQSISLRLMIISFFFIGVVVGGVMYSRMGLYVLLIGTATLIAGIGYDSLRLKVKWATRRYRKANTQS